MRDLREKMVQASVNSYPYYMHECHAEDIVDTILALIPRPTVRVKCDKCDAGEGKIFTEATKFKPYPDNRDTCPSCTDGWNEHLIEWEKECVIDCDNCCQPYFDGSKCNQDKTESKTLTLPDLIDPDVVFALGELYMEIEEYPKGDIGNLAIPHNKGTLRIGEKV